MPSTYSTIATTTLGSAAANVDFNSISGTFTDLVLICEFTTANNTSITLRVGNGSLDTGTNYSYTVVEASGSGARSGRDVNTTSGFITGHWSQITAGNRVATITNIQNYSNTTTNKTFISRGNISNQWTDEGIFLWRSTAAINTIRLFNNTGANFSAGSIFTLYGIKAA